MIVWEVFVLNEYIRTPYLYGINQFVHITVHCGKNIYEVVFLSTVQNKQLAVLVFLERKQGQPQLSWRTFIQDYLSFCWMRTECTEIPLRVHRRVKVKESSPTWINRSHMLIASGGFRFLFSWLEASRCCVITGVFPCAANLFFSCYHYASVLYP